MTAEKGSKVTKTKHSFSIRLKCFQDYVEDIPLIDIASRYDVNLGTLKGWIQTNDWSKRKKAVQSNAITDIETKYQSTIKKHQLTTLNRKLQLAMLIDKSIKRKLIHNDGTLKDLNPENIKFISDAFAKNANVDAKILGLLAPQNSMSVIIGSGSMVNLGIQGSPVGALPPAPTEKPIEAVASQPVYAQESPTPLRAGPVPF